MSEPADSTTPENTVVIDRPLTQDGPPVRLYLIDGSAYIFRAYHALPPLTRKSDGLPVGAVQGYCNMLWKLMRDFKGEDGADPPGGHLRPFGEDLPQRSVRPVQGPPPAAARGPDPPVRRWCARPPRAFGVPCVELPGYEADDLIATYACKARDMGGEAVIVSSDKDLMQLVGDGVVMFDPMKDARAGA